MEASTINVVAWNVNRHGAEDVLSALKDFPKPDVLILQEVTFDQRTAEKPLAQMGLKCCPYGRGDTAKRRYRNLTAIATGWEVDSDTIHVQQKPPFPELMVQTSVCANGRSFLVINVHLPNGSNHGWKKIDSVETLNEVVRQAKGQPCIVAGDFNEPQYVPLQDGGSIVTWGQEWNSNEGRYACWGEWTFESRTGKGKEWHNAVRWMFENQNEHGLRHAYWVKHGNGIMPVSHVTQGQPRWFDHMFVSPEFHVDTCEYLHDLRHQNHSDHSALSARLTLG